MLQNIIVGIILACVIIFLFMQDFRSPALVALTIPTALIFSMLVFHVMGMTINIISLSGLILGVGMIVDNTIVLTDNITARWQRGDDLRTAVLSGTAEVRGPMLSSVLTTCAVFIPLIFVSGIAGAMFYDEAMSVTIILLTAYLVTILAPWLHEVIREYPHMAVQAQVGRMGDIRIFCRWNIPMLRIHGENKTS